MEFARDFRAQGNSIRDAAFGPDISAYSDDIACIRIRGYAAAFCNRSRAGSHALGAAVVFGMALNTLLATVYIPNFYELMQKLQESSVRNNREDELQVMDYGL